MGIHVSVVTAVHPRPGIRLREKACCTASHIERDFLEVFGFGYGETVYEPR